MFEFSSEFENGFRTAAQIANKLLACEIFVFNLNFYISSGNGKFWKMFFLVSYIKHTMWLLWYSVFFEMRCFIYIFNRNFIFHPIPHTIVPELFLEISRK